MATTVGKTPAQLFALAFGAVYVLVGILGFFVTNQFLGGSANDKLIIFPVNYLHNIVHLAVGGLWLAASTRHTTAKGVNTLVGAVYLLVAILGFTGIDLMQTLLNIHTPASADNFLHLVSAAVALYFGTVGAGRAAPVTA